jgi:hypothetical protein
MRLWRQSPSSNPAAETRTILRRCLGEFPNHHPHEVYGADYKPHFDRQSHQTDECSKYRKRQSTRRRYNYQRNNYEDHVTDHVSHTVKSSLKFRVHSQYTLERWTMFHRRLCAFAPLR